MNISESIEKLGVVPVVVLNDANDAKPLAKALCEGGLPCAEVTFRTAAEQVDETMEAGAKFIVSPGFDPEIVDYCIEKNIPVFPGCSTATEVAQAVKRGLKVVKFFPAETSGGIKAIKALAAPYAGTRFMPTGGINAGNLADYLCNDCIIACGGSWMVKGSMVEDGEFDRIEQMTKEAVELVNKIRA